MLSWLESTSLAVWLQESPSIWSLPTVLTLHTAGMAGLVGARWGLDFRPPGIGPRISLFRYRWGFSTLALWLVFYLVTRAGMAVLVGASWVLDVRLLGIGPRIPLSAYRWVFPTLAIGLFVNLVTGVLLFVKNATVWGTALPFLVKMLLVVASVVTVLPLRSLVMRGGTEQAEIDGRARLLAIASILAWTGAVTAGRLLAYLVV